MGKGSKTDAEELIPSLALDEEIVASESRNSDTVSEDDLDSKFRKKNDPKQQELPTDEAAADADDGFVWSATDEPHATRRKLILAQHPEIKQLYGHCWMLKYKVLLAGALQLVLAHHFRGLFVASSSEEAGDSKLYSWLLFFVTAHVIGGTCNHMLMMALHELSHNLGFKKMAHNRIFAMFVANLPIGVPAAVTFKRYHMDHHKFQGVDGIDVDIPTELEGRIFNNCVTKFFFVCLQVAFYSLRPALVNPKPPGIHELLNTTAVIAFDVAVAYFWGPSALLYLLVSSVLGMGLHPVAGHFIAEHFVFPALNTPQQKLANNSEPLETYSYYGFVNYLTFNVGYHNEHHDFPFVPGSRLPQVRRIAAEFYDPLPHHTSYCRVLWDFIFLTDMTAFCRVKRASTGPDVGGVQGFDNNDTAVAATADTTTATTKKVQ